MIKRDPSRFLQIGFLGLLFLCVIMVAWWIFADLSYTSAIEGEVSALAGGGADAAAAAVATIAELSEGRANRLVWEGGFFLVVLIAGMAILTRTLRHDRELRRRQQNFLAAVSHEFKSPLASMQLAAETLVLRSADPDSKRLGQRMLDDCERLLRMVDNLLDTTRIEEGRHKVQLEQTALTSAVAATVDAFADHAARHDITMDQSVPPELKLAVDRTALDTMLRNLVDNAIKACIAGGGHRVTIDAAAEGDRLRLSVHDDGLGFPPEEAGLMFEKFHRLGDELTRKTPGTGLGLYIVKRLAELCSANIEATSAGPGQGAIMTLWFSQGSGR
jgi:signal transduction histidine kinase